MLDECDRLRFVCAASSGLSLRSTYRIKSNSTRTKIPLLITTFSSSTLSQDEKENRYRFRDTLIFRHFNIPFLPVFQEKFTRSKII